MYFTAEKLILKINRNLCLLEVINVYSSGATGLEGLVCHVNKGSSSGGWLKANCSTLPQPLKWERVVNIENFFFIFVLAFKIYLFIFGEGKGGRKRARETSVCGCLWCTGDLVFNPGT